MKKAGFAILLGIICLAAGIYLVPFGFQLADKEAKMMMGKIIPFKLDAQKPIEIQMGGIHVLLTLDQLSAGFNMSRYVYLGFDYPFRIALEDGRFLISIEVYNADGETIAKVVNNEWTVNENTIIARDRNYNAYAFEVVDSDLIPVIQVLFSPQNKMFLGGLFYVPNGRMLCTPSKTIVNPSSENISDNIEPIFNYPSEEHLGEMVTSSIHVTRNSAWIICLGVIFSTSGAILIPYGFWMLDKGKKSKTKTRRSRKRNRKPKTVAKKVMNARD